MEGTDTFFTLAEVSATFVGLSLVVGVLSEHQESVQKKLKWLHLRSFALLGLSVVAGCFAPIVLDHFNLSQPLIWRISSVLFITLWISGWAANAQTTRLEVIKSNPLSFGINLALVIGGWGMLLWNITFPGEYALALYVMAMILALVLGARFFYISTFAETPP